MLELLGTYAGPYVGWSIGSWLRYGIIAGGLYWVLYVGFRARFLRFRIQTSFPQRSELAYQIRWSLISLACMSAFSLVLYGAIRAGHTRLYFDIAEHGWAHFVGSVVLCVLGYDAWIYWLHRLLHTPWMYRNVHVVHHYSANPTPLAVFTFHPLEVIAGNLYYVLFLLTVAVHPLALAGVMALFTIYSLIAHMGYELFPPGFARHRFLGWLNTSTHHNMHHSRVGGNYGHLFNYWDRIMATNHSEYLDLFDAVTERARSAGTSTRGSGRAGMELA